MMKKLLEQVQKLADDELKMANEQFPLFASNHEGAAVILEEVEEADDEMDWIDELYQCLWKDVKDDEPENVMERAGEMKVHAIRCACECIQVAAMCEKIKMKK